MENVGFVNIKPGIEDPSVFDVPKECQEVCPPYPHIYFAHYPLRLTASNVSIQIYKEFLLSLFSELST